MTDDQMGTPEQSPTGPGAPDPNGGDPPATLGYPGAPPGWYGDPAGGPGQRWWDGYAWSDAVVMPTAPPPPPPWATASARLATSVAATLVASEQAMVNLVRLAAAMPGLYVLIVLAVDLGNADRLKVVGHQLRVIYHDAQNNTPLPTLHESVNFGWLSSLALLATLIAVILSLVWQHRAASAARSLGLPAHHSPGWGVGCWFVPVVNLFMPYQAIRDCLPAGSPVRGHVLRWWLLLMGMWTTGLTSVIAIFFSRGLALGFAIPSALCALGVLATAPGLVTAISAAHRALLEQGPVPDPTA